MRNFFPPNIQTFSALQNKELSSNYTGLLRLIKFMFSDNPVISLCARRWTGRRHKPTFSKDRVSTELHGTLPTLHEKKRTLCAFPHAPVRYIMYRYIYSACTSVDNSCVNCCASICIPSSFAQLSSQFTASSSLPQHCSWRFNRDTASNRFPSNPFESAHGFSLTATNICHRSRPLAILLIVNRGSPDGS